MSRSDGSGRFRAIYLGFALAFLALAARAAQVQLVEGREHAAVARASRTREVVLPAPRGGIFDRNGSPLALTEDVYHVDVTPEELNDREATITALVGNLELSRGTVIRQFRRKYAYFAGPFTSSQVQPLRAISGVYVGATPRRFRPNRSLAQSLIGLPAKPGVPASGLERVLDTLLRGTPGRAVVLKDQFGREFESPGRLGSFPVPGYDVFLTIDVELQDLVEQALAEAVDRYDAIGGEVVVMNPRTGQLLAVASRQADGSSPPSAFTSVFQPGSTAKVFAAAALITDSLVSPADTVWGENGRYTLGSRTIHDEHELGWMTLRDVIKHSSNIGIAKFTASLPPQRQFEVLRDFGMGTPAGVEFPAESEGILRPPHEWTGPSPVSHAMGYEFAVTMIQLAQAYASIANDGVMMRPTLIDRVVSAEGSVIYQHRPEPVRRVVSATVAATLRSMLRDVVDEGGTGAPAALMSMEVAGKTGTARRAVNGRYVPGSYTTSFVAIVPADDPQIVTAVKLDDPEGVYSTSTAAPLTHLMLEQVRAGQNSALDRRRIHSGSRAPRPLPATGTGAVPYVSAWPAPARPADEARRTVPDVVGATLREAARRLHQRGLRVRVDGWGIVDSIAPAAGTALGSGEAVTVFATPRSVRR